MHPAKLLLTKVTKSLLTAILTSASAVGNGCVLAVVVRFKSLRTVPNILIANLALVDLFNALINMPLMIYTVLEADWFRGKTLGILTSVFNRVFLVLNLTSMLAMMANTFLAISFDMKYLAWKSKAKALVCSVLIWIISVVTVMLFSIPLFDIDLGDVHVNEYRGEIYKQGKHFVASFMALFIISGAVICFLTTRAIRKKKTERIELKLPALQEKARLKDDIKAIKTIGITIAAYFLCYVPAIVYAVVGLQKENLADSWFGFIAWYPVYISSALNPIIYYLRARRCRSAFKQFLKDPFGSSDFKGNPNGRGNGGNRHDEVVERKRNGERSKGREVFKADSVQYSEERRDAIVMSLTKELDDDLSSHREVGHGSGYKGEKGKNGGEARALNRQVQNLCQGKGVDTEKVSVEMPKIWGLKEKTRKQQPSSSGNKLDPLEVSDMSKTWEPDGGKQELDRHCTRSETEFQGFSLRNQINTLSTGDEFEEVVKAAWVAKE